MNRCILSLVVRHFINIMALCLVLYLLGRNVMMTRRSIRAYRAAILLTIYVMLFECAGVILDNAGAAWYAANFAVNIAGFSCSAFIPYVLSFLCEDVMFLRQGIILSFPCCFTLLCALSPLTGWVFTVSHQNVYSRGPLFWTYIVTYIIGALFMLASNYRTAIHLAKQERRCLLGILLFFFSGVSVQILFPTIHSSWQCITLCLLLYYIFQRELQFRYDPLTGVLNRAAFDRDIKAAPVEIQLLAILDIDCFKSINDSRGHMEGDRVLSIVGILLRECFSKCGSCYRIGGDEFAILCTAGEPAFQDGIRKLLLKIKSEREFTPWFPNLSYGYHVLEPDESLPDALQKADIQMYRCKRS